ncbi:hemophore-related protein [Mycolicibacterium sp. 018/SC-01/001]|uniref:heme-binding protein n=1 Tax=Mycolicibacterium sp. 018/SC-01/001 TaxID=2592069 RepID=UPI00117C4E16|nr:heme-binding protein [Mycolicibacterium sp. 018/SC-01/001]TRW88979.1 hemophore-related protein [Mycolicibacterium sp. 018/SC-01/001]
MNSSVISVRKNLARVGAACVFGGVAVASAAALAPTASAAPVEGCSASQVAGTVGSATTAARQYLDSHPGANQVVTAAMHQPRPEAEANVRAYFTANPGEYYDLRGILAPIGDTQRTCNVSVLPADLQSAYDTFMAG